MQLLKIWDQECIFLLIPYIFEVCRKKLGSFWVKFWFKNETEHFLAEKNLNWVG